MKLLGISSGRRTGNSETLLKEAMMGAEELGVEADWLRLLDLDIKSCRFCKNCLRWEGGPAACVVKDDIPFLHEKLQECDGLILSVPVYILTPPGYFKLVCDRLLHDLAGVIQTKTMGGSPRAPGRKMFFDERSLKKRVGAFVCQGGASTPHWIGLGIPLMHCLTFPRQIDIVDQMAVTEISRSLLEKETLKRARRLGRNVAQAMIHLSGKKWRGDELGDFAKQAVDRPKWRGDEMGTCPVCHSNLLTVGKENPVECAICGSMGEIRVDGKKITVTFSRKELAISRLTLEGKRIHQDEIRDNMRYFMSKQTEIEELAGKYKTYKAPLKPPRKARVSPGR
jgi:multimeric flavodoxin WrbA